MKKLLVLMVVILSICFYSCENQITDITKTNKKTVNLSLKKPAGLSFGLFDVWFMEEDFNSSNQRFSNLRSAGVDYIGIAGWYADEPIGAVEKVYDHAISIGFTKVLIPISHRQVCNASILNEVRDYISHFKSKYPGVCFWVDEPYYREWEFGETKNNFSVILNDCTNQLYLTDPFLPYYSVPQSDLNKCYAIMYSYYPPSLSSKNSFYRDMLFNKGKNIAPLLGVSLNYTGVRSGILNNETLNTNAIKNELYTAAPYSNEIWFYSYEETNGSTKVFSLNDYSNISSFITLLISFDTENYGSWDNTWLTGYGGTNAIPCPADYDGDEKADLAVKDDQGNWYIDYASNGYGSWDITNLSGYGGSSAIPCPADYDGDGHADLAVKIDDGSTGRWLIDYWDNGFGSWDFLKSFLPSEIKSVYAKPCPADYNGDGKIDLAVINSTGVLKIAWCYREDSYSYSWDMYNNYSIPYNCHFVPGYYEGATNLIYSWKDDSGNWIFDNNKNGSYDNGDVQYSGYGGSLAIPCPGDYDGDGKTDLSVKNWDGNWLIDYYQINFNWCKP